MTRVKRGAIKTRRRERLLQHTKGYRWRRRSTARAAKQATMKAWTYQYRDRRARKRDFRMLWNIRVNAGARQNATTYGKLIADLKRMHVELDRKILSDLAQNEPVVFAKIVETARR